ncbi:MAG TPA: heme lyase CcmF/NrfE family subunit [Gemmatimonadaceae bacterium]|nr:heme lyase CcmF/NrfE family subunit [Gemmatimonadaceae bacterium]
MTGLIAISAIQVALAISIVGAVALIYGGKRGSLQARTIGYGALFTAFGLVTLSTLAMVYALVTHDFSISYVAQVGSRETPLLFTIISLWGALEGSILFWAFLLYVFAALAVYTHRNDEGKTLEYAAATLLIIGVFFLILLIGPANPFHAVSPVPDDGPGPNPLLQNHILMAVHPPLLYLGYVGFSVPFAFAVGAMVSGEVAEDRWIKSARTWTIAAWAFLTAAIIAGMWWSYEVLGWGGYWAWDPVENASLMPWLTATAFMHSIMVQERRAMLRVWNLNLIVVTFVLTVLGTFLTRSGILSSVHAFTQGTIGYYFLGFIAITLVASLMLVAGYAPELKSQGKLDDPMSRETTFLVSNLLLSVICFTVLLGTLFPLVAEAVRGVKVSVGRPFFNSMTMPVIVVVLFLIGIGPALPWRRTDRAALKKQLRAPAVALGAMVVISLVVGVRDPYALLAFAFGGFAIASNVQEFVIGVRARVRAHQENAAAALGRLVRANRHRYGGYLAHLGLLTAAMGIAGSSAFKAEREITLTPGQTVTVAGQTVRLDEVWGRDEQGRTAIGADMSLLDGSRVVGQLEPQQHFFDSSDQPIPTPSVLSSPRRDIYINLMAFAQDGSSATVHVLVEPLVIWIWIGGGIVCLGAIVGWVPRRRRAAVVVVPSVATASARAGAPAEVTT